MTDSPPDPAMLPVTRRDALRRLMLLGAAAAGAGILAGPAPAHAAPKADPWPFWEAHNPDSTAVIDHGDFAAFLEKAVAPGTQDPVLIRYGAVTPDDRSLLDGYLDALAAIPVRGHNRDQQMAYWINLYNALTLSVILDHYPVETIRDIDISPGFFSNGPWGKKLVEVEGTPLSLDDIEHRILRPGWRDPRIHYAVNCAAIGCPTLKPTPWTAETLEADLDRQAALFVNSDRGARFDADGDVRVSSIYDWFREDFGRTDADVLGHMARHAMPRRAEALRSANRIAGDFYDWSLNISK